MNRISKIIKKCQTEILELKNKKIQQKPSSRKKVCVMEDKNFKIIQSEENKEKHDKE